MAQIEHLEIGALISIRGIGRVGIVDIIQMEPYLRGGVVPMQDKLADYESEIQPKLDELRESVYNLQALQIKLKASKDELSQTQIKNSLTWAEREVYEDCDQSFVPKLAERLSFAALQPVSAFQGDSSLDWGVNLGGRALPSFCEYPGFSQSEVLSLQKEKLRAMEMRDTLDRLKISIEFVKQNIAIVTAKLAIQSLEI